MDSDPFLLLEKSNALRREPIHGQPQEKRFHFRHSSPPTKIIKPMDGNAQRTVWSPGFIRYGVWTCFESRGRGLLRQRRCVLQPRVGAQRLPWENECWNHQPQGGLWLAPA